MSSQSVTVRDLAGGVRVLTRLVALVLVAVALGACSLFDKDTVIPDEPADKLYNEGLYLLNSKKTPKDAAKKFEEVDRQHPYSEWARKSLIMSAYAYYEAGAYDDCINAARRYVTLHPGSPDAAYAQYLIGASYFDQIPEISRDQDRTEKAVQNLEEVARKYPNSEYAVASKRKIEIARDQLAGKEMDVGRQLLNERAYTGAINRFKVVVTRYQRTRHVEEALLRLTEAYMALGIVEEAQTSAAVLGHNFPDSRWYKDAYALMESKGLQPNENKGSWICQSFKAFKKLGLG
jgi:outer membrane protein assembly factor BamD